MNRATPPPSWEVQHGEPSWVEQAQRGDAAAFEKLYHRHVDRVYALCLRMTGDSEEAQEFTQEAFVRAWEKLDAFQARSAFGTWLHRLAVNVVLGRWRARGRRHERVVAIDDVEDPGRASPRHAGADEAPVAAPRQRIDLERAIAALPTGARTVFVLFDIEGYRHHEIAALTGLATGTCKAQLHRARQLLRKALQS